MLVYSVSLYNELNNSPRPACPINALVPAPPISSLNFSKLGAIFFNLSWNSADVTLPAAESSASFLNSGLSAAKASPRSVCATPSARSLNAFSSSGPNSAACARFVVKFSFAFPSSFDNIALTFASCA